MKLTPKQAAFVREYLIDLNATAAAGRAGYRDPAYGRQLITLPNVAESIRVAQSERAARAELTQGYVLSGLRGIAEDDDATSSARVRAFELLGKHQGMFVDRVDHTSKGEAMPAAVQIYLPANNRDEGAAE